jgi:hypothetical protein
MQFRIDTADILAVCFVLCRFSAVVETYKSNPGGARGRSARRIPSLKPPPRSNVSMDKRAL